MANVLINEHTLGSIADAIRKKTGKTDKLLPIYMPMEILNIVSGGASGNFNMTEVTLASNHSTQEWKTICTIPFVGQNLFNDKLFLMLIRKDTTEITYSIPLIMGCNSAYLNSSYALAVKRTSYGASISYKPNAVDGYQLSNPNGKDISRVGIKDSNGDIRIYPEQSYLFEAGTYVVIYGLLS